MGIFDIGDGRRIDNQRLLRGAYRRKRIVGAFQRRMMSVRLVEQKYVTGDDIEITQGKFFKVARFILIHAALYH